MIPKLALTLVDRNDNITVLYKDNAIIEINEKMSFAKPPSIPWKLILNITIKHESFYGPDRLKQVFQ